MEVTLQSGAKLVVTPADFQDADALRKAVLRAVRGIQLNPTILDAEMNLQSLIANPNLATVFIDRILSVATAEDVEDCIFRCGVKAAYLNQPFSRALFDDPKVGQQAREDFHEICVQILKANLTPFFKQTFSVLKTFTATPAAAPK